MYNRTRTAVVAIWTLIIVSFSAHAQTSNVILGKWKDAEHPEKQIEITQLAGKFVGKSTNSSQPADNGKVILKDLVWSQASKSYKGILINPDNGDEFKIEVKMVGNDRFKFTAGKWIFRSMLTPPKRNVFVIRMLPEWLDSTDIPADVDPLWIVFR